MLIGLEVGTVRGTRWFVGLVTVMAAAFVVGCSSDPSYPGGNGNGNGNGDGGGGGGSGADHTVSMTSNNTFSPASLSINVGETVQWRSNGSHSTTADPDLAQNPDDVQLPAGASTWNSGILLDGYTFSMTFSVPGTYRYFCIPHEISDDMVGEITVN